MSLKKDKFNKKDKFYMNLAINLAKDRIGLTGNNPSVGCVIVKNDQVISTGQTSLNGRPHAEFNAINKCNVSVKNATMYVSLEPCSHIGKTFPCTKLIIKNKIKKLFYAINDIDTRSANKAHKILNKKNIVVRKFLLKKKAENIYKSYFFSRKNNFPYIIGKIACSKDLYTSYKDKIISNEYSRSVSHLLRYKNQGILISSNTLNTDNPKLNCRLPGLESNSPIRFIIDKNLNSNRNSYIIKSAKKYKTYIFYNKLNSTKKKFFLNSGVKLIYTKLDKNNQINLFFILKKIRIIGISNLLVEGGFNLTTSFLKAKLFNEFYLFKSNIQLGKKGSKKISKILNKLPDIFNSKKKIETYLDKDELINYY